jgi:hypothetical protein
MIKKILFISSLCLAVGAECQTTKTKLIGLGMTPELAQYVASLSLSAKNDQYLQGRNAANTAFIDVLKVDSTDDTVLNSDTGDVIKLAVAGTTEITVNDDSLTFSGAAAKIVPGATSLTIKNNADSVDNLKITDAGVVTMAGQSLGWSYVTGANTACTTTCTYAAVFGVDLAAGASAPVLVGPSAATADACICAGPS